MIKIYFYGWYHYFRAAYKLRTKKHGAGAQPWIYCHRAGACARYIIDGQHRNSKGPMYSRKGLRDAGFDV